MTTSPGVYIVEWPEALAAAPICPLAAKDWISATALLVEGRPATCDLLGMHLSSAWVPYQTIVYVGKAAERRKKNGEVTGLGQRLHEYYQTPLWARSPHGGGRLIKTLLGINHARVWWAECSNPEDKESLLLRAFCESSSGKKPFANIIGPGLPKGLRLKRHTTARNSRS
jgi:hypothetical protein